MRMTDVEGFYTEEFLFVNKIKPAILINKDSAIAKRLRESKDRYKEYISNSESSVIFTHDEVDNIDSVEDKGLLLGYAPVAVNRFTNYNEEISKNEIEVREFINYGGIRFATNGTFNESLEFCNKQYRDKFENLRLDFKVLKAVTKSWSTGKKKFQLIENEIIEEYSFKD